MKTYKITGSMGVVAGYGHDNNIKDDPVNIFVKVWQEISEKKFEETEVYVGAIAKEGRAIYSPNWGCPNEGEVVIEFSAECNPEFANPEKWLKVAEEVIKEVKTSLKQTTCQYTIQEVEFKYLTS
jgi:hypothetical protein